MERPGEGGVHVSLCSAFPRAEALGSRVLGKSGPMIDPSCSVIQSSIDFDPVVTSAWRLLAVLKLHMTANGRLVKLEECLARVSGSIGFSIRDLLHSRPPQRL
ncbi:uncharacterized protein BO96DRAFT_469931 [Aspergillus niger CBS 101883]|uniref:Contig An11c0340, genomic contig n=2 Tax=Aspergillus niger TaxID=5061 RepID=A5ABU2_ASPNC|nr:uncharacterized protein BO96DRAFT_469931 [Aspergillus niger CBS 101883]XP_059606417.1 uncharacterized protein An11g10440 [Aspergillus niger]PYH51575.1 hypothetical protein BO96DRAFT_469931 [Aspergillus niger CBS 101883]CAK97127.1 unnamed protein product [Aspergillus niger]